MPAHVLRPYPVEILAIGRRQHGRITRGQLRRAGIPDSTITDWVASGRLVVEYLGVYRLPGAPATWAGEAMASLLYVEQRAVGPVVLATAAAGYAHGLLGCATPPRPVPILTPHRSRARVEGIHLGWDAGIATAVGVVDGLPVTAVPRTLVDLAARPPRPIGDILTDAWSRHLVGDLDAVAAALVTTHRPAGRWADRRIRARLDQLAVALEGLQALDGRPRSRTEVAAANLVVSAGLPAPALNAPITCCGQTWLLDLSWSDPPVDLEVDGPHHTWPSQRQRDEDRDHHLRDHLGMAVVRIPVEMVDDRPREVLARLAAAWPQPH